jgi:hypothetical protein
MSLSPAPPVIGAGIFDDVLDIVKNAAAGAAKGAATGANKKPATKGDNTMLWLALGALFLLSKGR